MAKTAKKVASKAESAPALPTEEDIENTRLISKVAWLYHKAGMNQGDIAKMCDLSQAGISRLLLQAQKQGIVRTEVFLPEGIYADLEGELESKFNLNSAHIFDVGSTTDESLISRNLGQLFAGYLMVNPIVAQVVGFTSWSRALRVTANSLTKSKRLETKYVVEMLGDVGDPFLQHQAALSTQKFSESLDATPMFLRIPGVVESKKIRDVLIENDYYIQEALNMFDKIEYALVGLGNCQIVSPLKGGDNFFTAKQFEQATQAGAVGQINLRFIDADGKPVKTPLNDLVIGINLDQLQKVPTRVGIAGGKSKYAAIRAGLVGGHINSLVTDLATAKWLVKNG